MDKPTIYNITRDGEVICSFGVTERIARTVNYEKAEKYWGDSFSAIKFFIEDFKKRNKLSTVDTS